MKKSTVFFDVGNVMIFFSYEKMIEKLADVLDTTRDEIHQFILKHNLQEKYELGHLTTEEFYRIFCRQFKKEFSLKEFEDSLNHTFSPNKEIIPVLESLKSNGHKLIVLSNTCAIHFDHLLTQYEFLKIFDEYILSHEVSLRKPDPKIYQLALSKAGEKAFFTDDLEENIKAANKEGLNSEVFTDTSSLTTHLSMLGFL